MRPHLEYCIQAWGSRHKSSAELLEWIHRRAMKKGRTEEILIYLFIIFDCQPIA